jgi:hypothetical protein
VWRTLLTRIEVDVWLHRLQVLIRDILTPLCGIALLFYLVATPGERPSYFIAAAGLIGLPVALKAQRRPEE